MLQNKRFVDFVQKYNFEFVAILTFNLVPYALVLVLYPYLYVCFAWTGMLYCGGLFIDTFIL